MDFSALKKISWYPGHMLKAQRDIKEKLAAVDLIVELVDARAPASTRNFQLGDLVQHKASFVVVGKSDLAAPETTAAWRRHWAEQEQPCLAVHRRDRRAIGRLVEQLKATARADARSRWGDKLRYNRRLRAMVIGLPNVGKSTLINALAGRPRAKTGPHPGVTRHQQWIDLDQGLELLDTPGIMVPAVSDPETGLKLGLLAVIKRRIVSDDLLAEYLYYQLTQQQRLEILEEVYQLPSRPADFPELLALVAARLGLKRTGDQPDTERAATRLIRDFREKKLGRLSLEQPPDQ